MSASTSETLNQNLIYTLFVRNHTPEGTFRALEQDLDRIKSLGTDIIWLMPLNPIGEKNRKGKQGSPYAVKDYRAVNPEFGTLDDFRHLVDEIHKRGMKVMMDVVYNHTAPDSVLAREHPEWFYKDEAGQSSSIISDWSDIIDLDYSHPDLQDYQIETLKMWAEIVDGFRCDVASRVPVEFWKKAMAACRKVNPDLIWLAESCHWPFIKLVRDMGRYCASDGELYEAFDICYDYDIWPVFEKYVRNIVPLSRWMEELEKQEAFFPENYIKMRCLENHDMPRMTSFARDLYSWKNWNALLFMLKGIPLIYEGQERRQEKQTDFFTQDVIEFENTEENAGYEAFIARMADLHKNVLPPAGVIRYSADDENDTAIIRRENFLGIFALKGEPESIKTALPDGIYTNLITSQQISVEDHAVRGGDLPLIVECSDLPEEELG